MELYLLTSAQGTPFPVNTYSGFESVVASICCTGDVLHVMHVVPPVGKDVAVADGFGDGSAELNDGVSEKYRNLVRHPFTSIA